MHCSKRILICARNTLFLYPRLALTIQNIDRPSKTAPELYSDILSIVWLFYCSALFAHGLTGYTRLGLFTHLDLDHLEFNPLLPRLDVNKSLDLKNRVRVARTIFFRPITVLDR